MQPGALSGAPTRTKLRRKAPESRTSTARTSLLLFLRSHKTDVALLASISSMATAQRPTPQLSSAWYKGVSAGRQNRATPCPGPGHPRHVWCAIVSVTCREQDSSLPTRLRASGNRLPSMLPLHPAERAIPYHPTKTFLVGHANNLRYTHLEINPLSSCRRRFGIEPDNADSDTYWPRPAPRRTRQNLPTS